MLIRKLGKIKKATVNKKLKQEAVEIHLDGVFGDMTFFEALKLKKDICRLLDRCWK